MDTTTRYMGLTLRNPVIVGSCGLTNKAVNVIKAADYGAGAVVLKSLFEEQILHDINAKLDKDDMYFWYPDAAKYVQDISKEHGVNEYLKLITDCRKKVKVPIIASVNCYSAGEWHAFAKRIQEAGADAIELNISLIPFDDRINCSEIAKTYIDIVKSVKKSVKIPIAVKLSPYFTNLIMMGSQLEKAGASGLVLFNRYYRPDIDIEKIALISDQSFSTADEITQSLRWVSILSSKVKCDISASTGVHDYTGVVKQLLVGASTVQVASVLYQNGLKEISSIVKGLEKWMTKHKFIALKDFRGKINVSKQNSVQFERLQFMKKTTEVI